MKKLLTIILLSVMFLTPVAADAHYYRGHHHYYRGYYNPGAAIAGVTLGIIGGAIAGGLSGGYPYYYSYPYYYGYPYRYNYYGW